MEIKYFCLSVMPRISDCDLLWCAHTTMTRCMFEGYAPSKAKRQIYSLFYCGAAILLFLTCRRWPHRDKGLMRAYLTFYLKFAWSNFRPPIFCFSLYEFWQIFFKSKRKNQYNSCLYVPRAVCIACNYWCVHGWLSWDNVKIRQYLLLIFQYYPKYL